MSKSLKTAALIVSGAILFLFGLFVVAQTAQVVELADRVDPLLGTVVLWLLIAALAALIVVPAVFFFRLSEPLRPPAEQEGEEFRQYLEAVQKRLARNPHLSGPAPRDRLAVEAALEELAKRSNGVIQQSASIVFLSTAVSQSGRLDTFVVLVELTRMIWRIAHLYDQRPSLRDLLRLYANVAGTAFVAGALDDIDISEQIAPVLSSVGGSAIGAIPGFQAGAVLFVNSVTVGAANAFLTLRVGIIARRYCGSLTLPAKGQIRRAASLEAAGLLGSIVAAGATKVARAVRQVTRDKLGDAVSGAAGYAKAAGSRVLEKSGLRKTR